MADETDPLKELSKNVGDLLELQKTQGVELAEQRETIKALAKKMGTKTPPTAKKKDDDEDDGETDDEDQDLGAILEEIKNLGVKVEAAAKKRSLSRPLAVAATTGNPAPTKKDFSALVADAIATKNLSKPDAVRFCVENHKEEHKTFLESGGALRL